jgi:hypothetical protein
LQDQLLTEQAGQPRLARTRLAGDEHGAPSNRQVKRLAIVLIAE